MSHDVAVIIHGAGSTPQFVASAFRPGDLGVDVVIAPSNTGGVSDAVDLLAAEVERIRARGDQVRAVGGVSLGAHAAALWAASGSVDPAIGLLLVMPAWTGPPADIAAMTAAAATEVGAIGSAAILARLVREAPHDWVVDALASAWPSYGDDQLCAALQAAAQSPGPSERELARINVPCGVVAVADDPLHPAHTAAQWARLIPHSDLVTLPRDLGGAGPRALGAAAAAALSRAASGSR